MNSNTNTNLQSGEKANQQYLPYPGDSKKPFMPTPTQHYPLKPPMEVTIRPKSTDGIRLKENASLVAQSDANRTDSSRAAAGQETFPYNQPIPRGTLSTAPGLKKSIHPPSLTPGFQPNKQSQQQGSKSNILRKPPAESFSQSRPDVQPGGLHQSHSMPKSRPPATSARGGPTLQHRSVERLPMAALMPPKIDRSPVLAAPLFAQGQSSGNNLASTPSLEFPKPSRKASASDTKRKDLPSTHSKASSAIEPSTVPSNKHGFGPLKAIRNTITSVGESLSGVTPTQTSNRRPNEGILRRPGFISDGLTNLESKPRTLAQTQERIRSGGLKRENLANLPPLDLNSSRTYPRALKDPRLGSSAIRKEPPSKSMKAVPNQGSRISHDQGPTMLGPIKQTVARPRDFKGHNTSSRPMLQLNQPHVPEYKGVGQKTYPWPNSAKHSTASSETQYHPYKRSTTSLREDSFTRPPPIGQQHPQRNLIPSHKSSIPADGRQEPRPPTPKGLYETKQCSSRSRNIGGGSNIVKSSKAISGPMNGPMKGPMKGNEIEPLQISKRHPQSHPNKDHVQHPARKPGSRPLHSSDKHGEDHQGDTKIPYGQTDRDPEYSAAQYSHSMENSTVHSYMIEQDYSVEQRSNELFEPFNIYSNNGDYETEPYYPEPYSGEIQEGFDPEFANHQTYTTLDAEYDVPFASTSHFNDLATDSRYDDSFPSKDNHEDQPPNAKNNEDDLQSVDSIGICEPFSFVSPQFDTYGQDPFRWSQEPSLPPHLDGQPPMRFYAAYRDDQQPQPIESVDHGWQGKGENEWQEEESQDGNQCVEETGTFSREYDPVNAENESRWNDETAKQHEDMQHEDIGLMPGSYAEQGYVGPDDNAKTWLGESDLEDFRFENPAMDGPEFETSYGYASEGASSYPYTEDATFSEDGVEQTLDEGNDQDEYEGDGLIHHSSDDEAEIEGVTESWTAENGQVIQYASANYGGGGYTSNDDLGSQEDERNQEGEDQSDDECDTATREGFERPGEGNGEVYYGSGDEQGYGDQEDDSSEQERAAGSDVEDYAPGVENSSCHDVPQGYGYESQMEEDNCDDIQRDLESSGYDGERYTGDDGEGRAGNDDDQEIDDEKEYAEDGENVENVEDIQYEREEEETQNDEEGEDGY